eukprot:191506-Amphidinium_carterae.2
MHHMPPPPPPPLLHVLRLCQVNVPLFLRGGRPPAACNWVPPTKKTDGAKPRKSHRHRKQVQACRLQ